MLSHYIGTVDPFPSIKVEALSLGVALVMIVLYILGLLYGFRDMTSPFSPEEAGNILQSSWSIRRSILVLGVSTFGVAFLSEWLVGAVEPVIERILDKWVQVGLSQDQIPIEWRDLHVGASVGGVRLHYQRRPGP